MGKTVRRVPKGWNHQKNERGEYIPLYDGANYKYDMAIYYLEKIKWDTKTSDLATEEDYQTYSFDQWHGPLPDPKMYMPQWNEAECTHFMMYENTTEGTPISPSFGLPEELAQWLSENSVEPFHKLGVDEAHKAWLAIIDADHDLYRDTLIKTIRKLGREVL